MTARRQHRILILARALWHTSRHSLGLCRRVCNTCRYSIPRQDLGDEPLEAAIEAAVAAVIVKHGILRVGIVGEETKTPYFSSVENVDLGRMIRWQRLDRDGRDCDNALLRSLERIHDLLWDDLATKPGWELIVHHIGDLEKSDPITLDITFAFHHAYADGIASKLFHQDLLEALNDAQQYRAKELQNHTLRFSSPPDLLPGMENIVPFKISWHYLLRTIWNEVIWQSFVPEWLKSKPPAESIPWTGREISVEPHRANIRLLEIPQHTLADVIQACRAHGTTLTPLLHVLIATSLAQRLPPDEAPSFTTVTPIDLRRYADAEYDVRNKLTALVSAHDDKFDAGTLCRLRDVNKEKTSDIDTFIWRTASSLSTRLRSKVDSLPNDDIVGMMSWVSDWQKFWTEEFGKKRGSTWEVSNIGSCKPDDGHGGAWKIERMVMTQGALPAGSAFSVNVAGLDGGPLCMSLTWQETVVRRELMEGLAVDLSAWMEALGAPTKDKS